MRYSSVAIPLALAARAAAVESDVWAFGNGFYTGPPTNAHITRATWSLVPPDVPSNYTVKNTDDEVWVSLWIGLSSTAGDYDADLYQPLLNWSPDNESQYVHQLLHDLESRMLTTEGAAPPQMTSGVSPLARTLPVSDPSLQPGTRTGILMMCLDGQNGQAYVTVPADTQVDFEGMLKH